MIKLGKPALSYDLFERGRVQCMRGWTFRISHIREDLWVTESCSSGFLTESELPDAQANAEASCTIGGLEGSRRHKRVGA